MKLNLNMKSILENKYVLYVIAFISGTSLLNLVLTKKINAVIFFIAIGYLTSFFNKNMMVILLVSLFATNLLLHSKLTIIREGMDDDEDGDDKQSRKGGKKKKDKKNKEGLSKLKPKTLAEDETEEDMLKNDIDYASTVEAAYDNLDKILSSDALKTMTDDTKKLAAQQKKLMSNVKEVQPMMENVLSMLKDSGIDSSKMFSMINNVSNEKATQ